MYGCVNRFVLDFFVFKQKTAYEMRISDWSSDVCSSDLLTKVDHWLRSARCPDNLAVVSERHVQAPCATAHKYAGPGTTGKHAQAWQIGRASCRERVCQYV